MDSMGQLLKKNGANFTRDLFKIINGSIALYRKFCICTHMLQKHSPMHRKDVEENISKYH